MTTAPQRAEVEHLKSGAGISIAERRALKTWSNRGTASGNIRRALKKGAGDDHSSRKIMMSTATTAPG